MDIYVVRPGDTVYEIARKYRVPPERIISQNMLSDPDRLTPGQALVIQFPEQLYTVQPGDTLGDIAARYGTTVNALWQNNPQLGGNDRIYPGQGLIISYSGRKVGCLAVNGYAYPNIDRKVLRRTLPYLTYLSIFSYGFDEDGALGTLSDSDLLAAAHEFGVVPILVLTTIDANGRFSSERASRLLRDEAAETRLIDNLAQTLLNKGYGGVDVDFEYIPSEDGARYTAFIHRLEERLRTRNLNVWASLAPKTSADQPGLLYEAHDYGQLGQAANRVLLMTYE